jgi:hypothetical protein
MVHVTPLLHQTINLLKIGLVLGGLQSWDPMNEGRK